MKIDAEKVLDWITKDQKIVFLGDGLVGGLDPGEL
jgi:hypothetical protein